MENQSFVMWVGIAVSLAVVALSFYFRADVF